MRRLGAAVLCTLVLAGCGEDTPAPEPPVANTATAAATGLRYAVIGDSYSNGEGVGEDQAWPVLLAERLTADGVAVELVANSAVSGWTSAQALADELPEFVAAQPDVATLQIGANDLVQGVSAGTFRRQFRQLLSEMAKVVGAQDIVVVTIPDFSVTPYGASFAQGRDAATGLRAFNAIVRSESRRQRVAVADIFALSQAMSDPALTAPDGLHPSALELGLWTDRIEPVARRLWSAASRR